MSTKVRRINDWRLRDELERSGPVAVLFVDAEGGKKCREARAEFGKLSNAVPEARFYEIDITEHPQLAADMAIERVPTAILFAAGGERVRHVGDGVAIGLGPALNGKAQA